MDENEKKRKMLALKQAAQMEDPSGIEAATKRFREENPDIAQMQEPGLESEGLGPIEYLNPSSLVKKGSMKLGAKAAEAGGGLLAGIKAAAALRDARLAKAGLSGIEKASEIGTKSMYQKGSPFQEAAKRRLIELMKKGK